MASDDQYPLTYPPGIDCWQLGVGTWIPEVFKCNNCSITSDMVNFLNLTGTDFARYLDAYCVRPPTDDDCPFGFCPNPDIAGSLVRVANYITGSCLAILIFYSPERVKEAFWSQILMTYSLLLTCGISLWEGQLTRFHTVVLISLVCSPINVYFTGYAARSFWSSHCLDEVLGKRKYLQRGLVFLSVAAWIAILVHAYLPLGIIRFAQDSCHGHTIVESVFLGTPFVYAQFLVEDRMAQGILFLLFFLAPPILVILYWVAAIIWRRHEIWPPGKPFRPKFCAVWSTVVKNYPFLRFWSVVVIPTYYWVATVELAVLYERDDSFSLTFGQVLALFATAIPTVEVIQLAPDLWGWFNTLSWVLWVRCIIRCGPTPQFPDSGQIGCRSGNSILELEEMSTSLPHPGRTQGLDP